jgi:hypothetical protein
MPKSRTYHPLRRLSALIAVAGCWGATVPAHPQSIAASPARPALHILWDQELLSSPSPAMDVRWASDHTVFVAWFRHGVSELALDGKFTARRNLFPDINTLGSLPVDFLAASTDYVVASSIFKTLGFRARAAGNGRVSIARVPIGIVQSLDLAGNRLLLLGDPVPKANLGAGVVWLGPLTHTPAQDLKPILYDVAGARAPNLVNCAHLLLGAARFLPDGSFIVVPGFQPGAHLFGPSGRLLRSWDTLELGLDADIGCPGITDEKIAEFGRSAGARGAYVNQYHVLDGVLPLAQGPGLIVRSVVDGKVHWQVVVLQPAGHLVYDVPFTGGLPYDRLRGDVQGDRIVLLLGPHEFDKVEQGKPFAYKPTHLYVAELPRILEAPAQTGPQEGRQQ